MTIEDTISKEKLLHYLNLTKEAREKATAIHPEGSKEAEMLAVLIRMADDYSSDANYFMENGDYVRAFGAITFEIIVTGQQPILVAVFYRHSWGPVF